MKHLRISSDALPFEAGRGWHRWPCLLSSLLLLALISGGRASAADPLPQPPTSQTEARVPRLVFLFAPCTVSKSYLSPYDGQVAYTPNLARLAADGVTFEAHRTEAGSSGIAYASLFSGAQVDRHGVSTHPTSLPDELYLVTEAFADAGFGTFYWNGHGMASAALNYAQGVRRKRVFDEPLLSATNPFRGLLQALKLDPTKRAFVMTNVTTAHGPYSHEPLKPFLMQFPARRGRLPAPVRGRMEEIYRRHRLALSYNFPEILARVGLTQRDVPALAGTIERLYAANIWKLDSQFGAVLDAIDDAGLQNESIVAFTADHGEVMYRKHEAFSWTHSASLAPEVIEIPWILRAPGLEPTRYAGVTRSIDVYPTLLGLAGITLSEDRPVDGVDLSGPLRGRDSIPLLSAYSHTGATAKQVIKQMRAPNAERKWGRRMKHFPTSAFRHAPAAMRRRNLVVKLRTTDGETFDVVAFDTASDPYESRDIYDPENPEHAAAARDLRQYKERMMQSVASGGQGFRSPSQKEQEEKLRALGYIE